jgi:quinol monooxygenase YgiN
MRVDLAERTKVIKSLSRIIGPIRASAGCISCDIFVDVNDPTVLLFDQAWTDVDDLTVHFPAKCVRVLLSALDYAVDRPNVRVDTLTDTRGLEFLARCLDDLPPEK